MKRFLFAALAALTITPALAADFSRMPILALSRTADPMPLARLPADFQRFAQANPGDTVIQPPPPVFDAPAAAPVIVSSAPPKVDVAFGNLAGSLLEWLAVVLTPVLAPFLVDLYVKFRARLGLQTSDAQRAKFQEIVENGVALGAHNAQASLSGTMTFDVKNKIMADAVTYAKAHGADTLKALGVDPNSPEATEAIQARAAKMFADLDAAATAVAAGVPATPPSPLAPKPAATPGITTDASA